MRWKGFRPEVEVEVLEDKREVIIIVDDDATNLAIGRTALEDDYEVFTAMSGDKLFRILDRVLPDMILLDIEMPSMGGYDVMRKLKRSEHLMGIPVVFISGNTDAKSQTEALNLGAVGYIIKPLTREMLVEVISEQLKYAN